MEPEAAPESGAGAGAQDVIGHDDGLAVLLEAHPCAAPSDAQLVRRAVAGDERAFEAILGRHGKVLRAVARRYTGAGVELDDALQIAHARAWRALDKYDPERGALPPYLAWVAECALQAHWKHLLKPHRWADESPLNIDGYAEGVEHVGSDTAAIVLQRERLAAAWNSLGPRAQFAINAWLAAEGGLPDARGRRQRSGLTVAETAHASEARRRARRVLAELG